jgi:hypothetical protein
MQDSETTFRLRLTSARPMSSRTPAAETDTGQASDAPLQQFVQRLLGW